MLILKWKYVIFLFLHRRISDEEFIRRTIIGQNIAKFVLFRNKWQGIIWELKESTFIDELSRMI